jgi:hypothetical protein
MSGRRRSRSNPDQLRRTASNLHSHGDQVASTSHAAPLGSGSLGPLASGTEGTINSHLGALPGHVSQMADRVHQGGHNIESNASNIDANEDHVASSFRGIGTTSRAPHPPRPVAPGGPYYVTNANGKRVRVDPPPDVVSLNHPGINSGTPLPGNVYRVDDRPPNQIFQHGFTSHGTDYNLWQHQTGGSYLNNTGYISTTQKPGAANQFLTPSTTHPIMNDNGVLYQYRQGQIYHIDPTGNLVHLPSQHMTGDLQDTYSAQEEWAAVHHINPQNIQGVSTHDGYFSIGGHNAPPPNTPHPTNPPPTYQANPNHVPYNPGYNPYTDPNSGFHNGIPNIADRPPDTGHSSESDSGSESESD